MSPKSNDQKEKSSTMPSSLMPKRSSIHTERLINKNGSIQQYHAKGDGDLLNEPSMMTHSQGALPTLKTVLLTGGNLVKKQATLKQDLRSIHLYDLSATAALKVTASDATFSKGQIGLPGPKEKRPDLDWTQGSTATQAKRLGGTAGSTISSSASCPLPLLVEGTEEGDAAAGNVRASSPTFVDGKRKPGPGSSHLARASHSGTNSPGTRAGHSGTSSPGTRARHNATISSSPGTRASHSGTSSSGAIVGQTSSSSPSIGAGQPSTSSHGARAGQTGRSSPGPRAGQTSRSSTGPRAGQTSRSSTSIRAGQPSTSSTGARGGQTGRSSPGSLASHNGTRTHAGLYKFPIRQENIPVDYQEQEGRLQRLTVLRDKLQEVVEESHAIHATSCSDLKQRFSQTSASTAEHKELLQVLKVAKADAESRLRHLQRKMLGETSSDLNMTLKDNDLGASHRTRAIIESALNDRARKGRMVLTSNTPGCKWNGSSFDEESRSSRWNLGITGGSAVACGSSNNSQSPSRAESDDFSSKSSTRGNGGVARLKSISDETNTSTASKHKLHLLGSGIANFEQSATLLQTDALRKCFAYHDESEDIKSATLLQTDALRKCFAYHDESEDIKCATLLQTDALCNCFAFHYESEDVKVPNNPATPALIMPVRDAAAPIFPVPGVIPSRLVLKAVGKNKTGPTLFYALAEAAADTADAEQGVLYLVDRARNELVGHMTKDNGEKVQFRTSCGGVLSQVMNGGRSRAFLDLRHNLDFIPGIDSPPHYPASSMVLAPIFPSNHGKPIGLLQDVDADLLQSLASMATSCLSFSDHVRSMTAKHSMTGNFQAGTLAEGARKMSILIRDQLQCENVRFFTCDAEKDLNYLPAENCYFPRSDGIAGQVAVTGKTHNFVGARALMAEQHLKERASENGVSRSPSISSSQMPLPKKEKKKPGRRGRNAFPGDEIVEPCQEQYDEQVDGAGHSPWCTLGVPITDPNTRQVFATLQACNKRGGHRFTDADVKTLKSFCGQASLVAMNSEANQKLERCHDFSSGLQRFAERMAATLDYKGLGMVVESSVKTMLGLTTCALLLTMTEEDLLKLDGQVSNANEGLSSKRQGSVLMMAAPTILDALSEDAPSHLYCIAEAASDGFGRPELNAYKDADGAKYRRFSCLCAKLRTKGNLTTQNEYTDRIHPLQFSYTVPGLHLSVTPLYPNTPLQAKLLIEGNLTTRDEYTGKIHPLHFSYTVPLIDTEKGKCMGVMIVERKGVDSFSDDEKLILDAVTCMVVAKLKAGCVQFSNTHREIASTQEEAPEPANDESPPPLAARGLTLEIQEIDTIGTVPTPSPSPFPLPPPSTLTTSTDSGTDLEEGSSGLEEGGTGLGDGGTGLAEEAQKDRAANVRDGLPLESQEINTIGAVPTSLIDSSAGLAGLASSSLVIDLTVPLEDIGEGGEESRPVTASYAVRDPPKR
eukprot:gene3290-13313_t